MKIIPIKAPSQHHLQIADITDDIILTKEGGAALVLETSALNFSLLSEREQEAMIFAYAALLNSLTFPIQIVVHSQKKDISAYLFFLKKQQEGIANPKLKNMMSSYRTFVANVVKKRNVLEKQFFVVIHFSPLELGISVGGFLQLLPLHKKTIPFPKSYVVKKAKMVLYPRRDHIIRQSGRLGIKVRQLTTEDLAKTFLEIYQPQRLPQMGKGSNGEFR